MFQPRTYRQLFRGENLRFFNCRVRETDLQIGVGDLKGFKRSGFAGSSGNGPATDRDRASRKATTGTLQTDALMSILRHRASIEIYLASHPGFQTSFEPLKAMPDAPAIIKSMCAAGQLAGVGPMAAVAGAISQFVGQDLLAFCGEIIVENGGDIFLKTLSPRKVGIHAGSSPFSGRIALLIPGTPNPVGICTSSGTVGHSVSLGRADAAVVVARDAALADAVATAVGNLAKSEACLHRAAGYAAGVPGVLGTLVILGHKMAAWGEIELVGL